MAAYCYCHRKTNGWMIDRDEEIAETTRLARRAVELDKDDAVALSCGGFWVAPFARQPHAGRPFFYPGDLLYPHPAPRARRRRGGWGVPLGPGGAARQPPK